MDLGGHITVNVNPKSNLGHHSGTQHSVVWNRLNSEREEIREALLRGDSHSVKAQSRTRETVSGAETSSAAWHRLLLQNRLRKLDDALDRLLTGTYGNCAKCGRWIEDTKLDFDPAISFCLECWTQMQIKH
jgi:RNA polymerase-binding transcription factor DksA